MAQGSMAYVNIKPEILVLHGPKVLKTVSRFPVCEFRKRCSKTTLTGKSYRVLADTISRVNSHASHSKSVSVTTPSRRVMAGAAAVSQAYHSHEGKA
jgi:hypothetical protein